jgi:hypothetical protein
MLSSGALLGLAACAHPGAQAVAPRAAPTPAAAAVVEMPATPAAFTPSVQPTLTLSQLGTLRNLTAADLTARLGRPDFKRQEETAQIWQYRGTACVLDVFLYQEGSDLKVLQAVTRSRSDAGGPPDRCMPFGAAAS